MMFRDNLLKDRTIIITGGSTGLGHAMAEKFGLLGAKLAIVSRNEENLKAAEKKLRKIGIECEHSVCNIRDFEQISRSINEVVSSFGSFNVLINNAAGNFVSPSENLTAKGIDAIVDTVLKGTIYFSTQAGKYWIENHIKASILSIAATYSWTGSGYVMPSAAAKAGVLAMTRSLAAEWGPKGIKSVAIAPGPFPTKGAWDRLVVDSRYEDMLKKRNPLGRFGNLDEISDLAAYLISPGADYINGEVVTIDGGEWLNAGGEFNILGNLSPEEMAVFNRRVK
ncbi:SDR family oxidoreductase [Oxyplasma meridianum]|uniref:SDR family oxidoreductase n=1 Tax=Oxyplasma meridianum TaxID=3073602 RepID=A0AAX4NF87_9ARCH